MRAPRPDGPPRLASPLRRLIHPPPVIPGLFELIGEIGCFPTSDLSDIDLNTGVHPKFGAVRLAVSPAPLPATATRPH